MLVIDLRGILKLISNHPAPGTIPLWVHKKACLDNHEIEKNKLNRKPVINLKWLDNLLFGNATLQSDNLDFPVK